MTISIQTAMTQKLVTVSSEASLASAETLMKEKRIRHLLVIDSETQEAVGILSDRQLQLSQLEPQMAVEWLMSTPIITVDPGTPLRQAIFKMLENKISALIVADSHDQVRGIVTTDDLLWFLAHSLNEDKENLPLVTQDTKITLGELINQLSLAGI
ncbi:MAG: CBS domain-containing protein [Bdellovibrionales bacterium]